MVLTVRACVSLSSFVAAREMPQKKQSAKQAAQPPPQVSMAEAADPFGAVVQLVDKKVRNMEKRKVWCVWERDSF